MTISLRPGREHILELRQIFKLDAAELDSVLECLDKCRPPLQSPNQLTKVVSEVVRDEVAQILVKQLFSLNGLVGRFGTTHAEIVDGLQSFLRDPKETGDTTEWERQWQQFSDTFLRMLQCNCVRLSATANELSYDYANLLRHVRILSDIRPLFNDEATAVEAAVISHTLRLHYDSSDGEHELSVALDEADIAKLMKHCKRALDKSLTAKKLMEEKAEVPAILTGTESGENI